MRAQNRKWQLIKIALLLLCGSSAEAKPRRLQYVPPGSWGALHIRMEVSRDSATLEYDCAKGTIKGPLVVDRNGHFNFTGTHVREHGGPIRDNEPSNSQPARFTGTVNGQTMKLTVTLAQSNVAIGTFVLTRGGPGRLLKCR